MNTQIMGMRITADRIAMLQQKKTIGYIYKNYRPCISGWKCRWNGGVVESTIWCITH